MPSSLECESDIDDKGLVSEACAEVHDSTDIHLTWINLYAQVDCRGVQSAVVPGSVAGFHISILSLHMVESTHFKTKYL